MDAQDQPQQMQETVNANTISESQSTSNSNLQELGSCKREECRCIHEHGLIPVRNADGSVSQYTKEQAQSMLASLKGVEESLKQNQ